MHAFLQKMGFEFTLEKLVLFILIYLLVLLNFLSTKLA